MHDVKTGTLKEKDVILVKPGEKVAADGIILEGESYLNESMLTGESKPVKKIKGDKVIAGSINGNGSFKVTVSHAAKDSFLSQVVKLVDDAQKAKSKTQLLADKAARWLTLIAIVAGVSYIFVLVFNGPCFRLCHGKNGYSDCYLLPACFRIGCTVSSCKINFAGSKKRVANKEQNII